MGDPLPANKGEEEETPPAFQEEASERARVHRWFSTQASKQRWVDILDMINRATRMLPIGLAENTKLYHIGYAMGKMDTEELLQ